MGRLFNFKLLSHPVNWITVGLMTMFFVFALREVLRLFEGTGRSDRDAVTPVK